MCAAYHGTPYDEGAREDAMKKRDLTERIARDARLSAGTAADELDDAIHRVLKNLRSQNRPRATALERLLHEAAGGPKRWPAKP